MEGMPPSGYLCNLYYCGCLSVSPVHWGNLSLYILFLNGCYLKTSSDSEFIDICGSPCNTFNIKVER